MANIKYLLPCSCGQEIPVELAQAGQEVRCACGIVLEVPTLQGLRALKRAPVEVAARPRSTWGLRQQLLLVGAMITVASLVVAGYFYRNRPQMIDLNTVSPMHAWVVWQELRLGVRFRSPEIGQYHAMVAAHSRWMGVVGVVAALGLLTMASSLLVPKKRSKRALMKDASPQAKVQG
jgi:hypothetical protein